MITIRRMVTDPDNVYVMTYQRTGGNKISVHAKDMDEVHLAVDHYLARIHGRTINPQCPFCRSLRERRGRKEGAA